jgi:hypothetical protein
LYDNHNYGMTELQQKGNTSSQMEEAMMCYQSLQQKATSMHYIKAKRGVQNGPLASIFYIPLIPY